jgi:hypothetical protein
MGGGFGEMSALLGDTPAFSPNPPPMPHNYSGRLASTRQEIDNLVKMQAEQDLLGDTPALGSDEFVSLAMSRSISAR